TASGISRPLLRTWGKDLTHRLQALVPELLLARLHAPVGELGVLHRHLALLGALGVEPDLDGSAVGPGDAHGLVLRRLADDDVHPGKPPCPLALLAPGAEEAAQRHSHRLAARGLVAPVAALAPLTQSADPFVPHGDVLRPPAGHLVLLVHVQRDRAV